MTRSLRFQSVESSHVSQVGYDEAHRRLYVTFQNDETKVYAYHDIDRSDFETIVNASSVGKALRDFWDDRKVTHSEILDYDDLMTSHSASKEMYEQYIKIIRDTDCQGFYF